MQPVPELTPLPKKRPAAWMLLVIALPIGMLLHYITGGWDNLSQAIMTLMGWTMEESTVLQRHGSRLIAALIVPWLLALVVLFKTPLGRWLAPNRLALGGLMLADGLVLAVALRGLFMASIHQSPFLSGAASTILTPIAVTGLAIGVASLLGSTLWHRLIKHRPRALHLCKTWLSPV